MNESQRREWLETLLTSQLVALLHVADLYHISAAWDRAQMINNLSRVEGIEITK